jgi:hypothetical protein
MQRPVFNGLISMLTLAVVSPVGSPCAIVVVLRSTRWHSPLIEPEHISIVHGRRVATS